MTMTWNRSNPLVLLVALALAAPVAYAADATHQSGLFAGKKVNGGTVTHKKEGGRDVLELSADFVVPDTPAPHWQVVDSKGNVFLLQRLKIKDDKVNQSIVLPTYIKDVARVQIWCAWAETLLGEASFHAPVG
jgi:hypothetical protein